jgi:hypothetical protein
MPFPINFINLVYLAIMMFYEEESWEKLNEVFVSIGYLVFFVPILGLIILMNFIMMPVFYVFNFIKILKKDPKHSFRWLK